DRRLGAVVLAVVVRFGPDDRAGCRVIAPADPDDDRDLPGLELERGHPGGLRVVSVYLGRVLPGGPEGADNTDSEREADNKVPCLLGGGHEPALRMVRPKRSTLGPPAGSRNETELDGRSRSEHACELSEEPEARATRPRGVNRVRVALLS